MFRYAIYFIFNKNFLSALPLVEIFAFRTFKDEKQFVIHFVQISEKSTKNNEIRTEKLNI